MNPNFFSGKNCFIFHVPNFFTQRFFAEPNFLSTPGKTEANLSTPEANLSPSGETGAPLSTPGKTWVALSTPGETEANLSILGKKGVPQSEARGTLSTPGYVGVPLSTSNNETETPLSTSEPESCYGSGGMDYGPKLNLRIIDKPTDENKTKFDKKVVTKFDKKDKKVVTNKSSPKKSLKQPESLTEIKMKFDKKVVSNKKNHPKKTNNQSEALNEIKLKFDKKVVTNKNSLKEKEIVKQTQLRKYETQTHGTKHLNKPNQPNIMNETKPKLTKNQNTENTSISTKIAKFEQNKPNSTKPQKSSNLQHRV